MHDVLKAGEPGRSGWRIVAQHFVAGLEMDGGYVVLAAPIIKYMRGWTHERVQYYCELKRWDFEQI